VSRGLTSPQSALRTVRGPRFFERPVLFEKSPLGARPNAPAQTSDAWAGAVSQRNVETGGNLLEVVECESLRLRDSTANHQDQQVSILLTPSPIRTLTHCFTSVRHLANCDYSSS
jgi:hypothetical protein